MKFINPTGYSIRNDDGGLGHHGAPRGNRKHDGIDLICKPNQDILMPVDGIVVRTSLPYKNDPQWQGVYIYNQRIEIKMWYLYPKISLYHKFLKAGTVIGKAQDISQKYEGVTPHIHLRICRVDPCLLFNINADTDDYEIVI